MRAAFLLLKNFISICRGHDARIQSSPRRPAASTAPPTPTITTSPPPSAATAAPPRGGRPRPAPPPPDLLRSPHREPGQRLRLQRQRLHAVQRKLGLERRTRSRSRSCQAKGMKKTLPSPWILFVPTFVWGKVPSSLIPLKTTRRERRLKKKVFPLSFSWPCRFSRPVKRPFQRATGRRTGKAKRRAPSSPWNPWRWDTSDCQPSTVNKSTED